MVDLRRAPGPGEPHGPRLRGHARRLVRPLLLPRPVARSRGRGAAHRGRGRPGGALRRAARVGRPTGRDHDAARAAVRWRDGAARRGAARSRHAAGRRWPRRWSSGPAATPCTPRSSCACCATRPGARTTRRRGRAASPRQVALPPTIQALLSSRLDALPAAAARGGAGRRRGRSHLLAGSDRRDHRRGRRRRARLARGPGRARGAAPREDDVGRGPDRVRVPPCARARRGVRAHPAGRPRPQASSGRRMARDGARRRRGRSRGAARVPLRRGARPGRRGRRPDGRRDGRAGGLPSAGRLDPGGRPRPRTVAHARPAGTVVDGRRRPAPPAHARACRARGAGERPVRRGRRRPAGGDRPVRPARGRDRRRRRHRDAGSIALRARRHRGRGSAAAAGDRRAGGAPARARARPRRVPHGRPPLGRRATWRPA